MGRHWSQHSGPDIPPPQVFREQGIDGETLPLLTEEHLLTTMGLKLGPALKIRAQVSASWGQQSPEMVGQH